MQFYYNIAQKYDVMYRQNTIEEVRVSEQCTHNERYVNNNSENYNFREMYFVVFIVVLLSRLGNYR